jgi:hypothetical protein
MLAVYARQQAEKYSAQAQQSTGKMVDGVLQGGR